MQRYFELLDLSPTATRGEIKTQYQLLMRVYDPERFFDPADKSYADHVREKLTEAFCTLVGAEHWSPSDLSSAPAFPRVEPTLIDWGVTHQGEHLAAQVRIYLASQPQNLKLTPNAAWLTVGRGERIKQAGDNVYAFAVMVNTENLLIGKKYLGQIKVEIDTVTQYVFLTMKIDPPFPKLDAYHRWLLGCAVRSM